MAIRPRIGHFVPSFPGPTHPALWREIRALRLDGHATLLGAVGEERVLEELRAAYAFARPSHHEPLGVALMEAMACGLPVLGTAAGGVRELVTHGVDGILVPPRDPAALANALDGLARAPDRAIALARAARARVERDFDAGRSAWTLMREMGLRPFDEIEDDLPPIPPAPLSASFRAGPDRWRAP